MAPAPKKTETISQFLRRIESKVDKILEELRVEGATKATHEGNSEKLSHEPS